MTDLARTEPRHARHASGARPRRVYFHEPALRAVLAAAAPVAELAIAVREPDLLATLVLACGELVHGFSAAPDSIDRKSAHHRAWVCVRELDRELVAARLGRRAPATVVGRAQRAIDRADVMVGALTAVDS